MASRNYHAWIRAARKASAKTGGLSLPAARKAYKIVSERLGRPAKGKDVSAHPRIFKEAIPVASGGTKPKAGSAGAKAMRTVEREAAKRGARMAPKARPEKTPRQPGRVSPGMEGRGGGVAFAYRIDTFEQYEDFLDDFDTGEYDEYQSTEEYGETK